MNSKTNDMRRRTMIRSLGIPLTLVVSAWAMVARGQATTGWSPTAGGTYSYSDTNNWADSTINGVWHSSLALAGGQTITVNSDLSPGYGLSFNYTGNSGITLRGTGGIVPSRSAGTLCTPRGPVRPSSLDRLVQMKLLTSISAVRSAISQWAAAARWGSLMRYPTEASLPAGAH